MRLKFTRDEQAITRDRENNASAFADVLKRVTSDMEQAIPMAKKLFYDFAHLRRNETIMGCRTQDEWAQKHAKRTARALRYMFEGGSGLEQRERRKDRKDLENQTEMISVLPPVANDLITEEGTEPDDFVAGTENVVKEVFVLEPQGPKGVSVESERRIIEKLKAEIQTLKTQLNRLLMDIPERAYVPEELRDQWDELKSVRI